MSVIDNLHHSVLNFTSGVSKALSGQRLVVLTYKKVIEDKSSIWYKVKRDSKCVSVPLVTDSEVQTNLNLLLPHITDWLHSVQDKIIREKLDEGLNVTTISQSDINLNSICDYLDSSNESGRITKESVEKWFDSNVIDTLKIALEDRLGVSDSDLDAQIKISRICEEYKSKLSSLAGGKTIYSTSIANSLLKCLSLLPDSDQLSNRFVVRLNKMIELNSSWEDGL